MIIYYIPSTVAEARDTVVNITESLSSRSRIWVGPISIIYPVIRTNKKNQAGQEREQWEKGLLVDRSRDLKEVKVHVR